jgi:predicted  nucleic acid-binding Zn-ribbon protein
MNFENVLKYQKADIEYRKLRKTISSDPNNKKMAAMKQAYEAAKQKNADSEALATALLKTYDDVNAFINDYAGEIDSLCEKLNSGVLDEEEEKATIERLYAIKDMVGEWEKQASKLKADADKAINDNLAAQKEGAGAKKSYAEAKEAYEELKKSMEKELNEKKTAAEKARAEVDAELLEMYDKLVAANVIPPFVRAAGTDKEPACGCGLTFSESKKSALATEGFVTCDSCHRIVIK